MIISEPGQEYGNFKVVSLKYIDEYESTLIKLKNFSNNMEIVQLFNEDRENLFAFIFRTPVSDNTGVPHILEHSVLCGSNNFPSKDPFLILLKGSMNTYLNAFTSQDCTVYLASSINTRDFYNLMLVYGDAVFNPLLKHEVFLQEGYHYEIVKQNQRNNTTGLKIGGVVYNEMMGNYSSKDSIAANWSVRSLFPDTTYGFDTGGDPEVIPDLKYEDFMNFYKRFYHPANCKVFFYGNIPVTQHIDFLNQNFLKETTNKPNSSKIIYPSNWKTPIILQKPYCADEKSKNNRDAIVTVNWLTARINEPFDLIKLELLYEILLGNSGSPLRKRLIESQLGEDLSSASGLDTSLTNIVFSVGLRGTEKEKAQDILDFILNALQEICNTGIDSIVIEGALHRMQFQKKEINSSGPMGIKLLLKLLRGWIHDEEPELTLEFSFWLELLIKYVRENPEFYKDLIKKFLMENNHRSMVVVHADIDKKQESERKLHSRIESILNNKDQLEKITNDIGKLNKFQAQLDDPVVINKIPSLDINDLPVKITSVEYNLINIDSWSSIISHNIHTNDIIYLDFAFDIGFLAPAYLPYLPIFGKCLFNCGLPGKEYDEVAQWISLYTGGISTSLSSNYTSCGELKNYLMVHIKMLGDKYNEAVSLLGDLLLRADFSSKQRIKDLFVESRNRYQAAIVPHGNYYVSLRAGAKLSKPFELEENWHGISQYLFLNQMIESKLENNYDDIIEHFEDIRKQLFYSNRLIVNVSCSQPQINSIKQNLMDFSRQFSGPKQLVVEEAVSRTAYFENSHDTCRPGEDNKIYESFITSSLVNFTGMALKGSIYGTRVNAVESVLSHLINTGYLWDQVRVSGGAYGASSSSYGLEGLFTFASYRDPHIQSTLKAFEESLKQVRDKKVSADQLRLAIIGSVGKDEKPLRGTRKGFVNFKRIMYEVSDELRQKQRDAILSTTVDELADCASNLLSHMNTTSHVVISNKENLDHEARENPGLAGNRIIIPV